MTTRFYVTSPPFYFPSFVRVNSFMTGNNRRYDEQIEGAVGGFLDTYFYPHLTKGKKWERIHDKHLQIRGVDVRIGNGNIDEKAKVRACLNRVMMWPSFELSFLDRTGTRQDGWFLRHNLTTHYLISNVWSQFTEDEITDKEKIDHLRVLIVPKKDVRKLVHDSGLDLSALDREVRRQDPDSDGRARLNFRDRGMLVSWSPCFRESPVNLSINRNLLAALPSACDVEVRRSGIISMRE